MDIEDDGYDDEQFDDELDDEDPPEKKKRVATSTKIVLVVAGWLLLTLFLVGEFSKNKTGPDTASAQLETTTPEFDDGGTPDVVDTEAELEFDLDGDGFLDETERTAALDAFEASVESGEVAIGESDVSASDGRGGDGGSSGADGETATPAVPGAAPSSGASGSSTTTTAKPAGGGGSPTTTAAPTTTKPGNAPTTTSPTTTAPPPPPSDQVSDSTIVVTGTPGAFVLSPRNFTIAVGSRVRMQNSSNKDHRWKVADRAEVLVAKSGGVSPYQDFNTKGTFDYRCTIHDKMDGTITVE